MSVQVRPPALTYFKPNFIAIAFLFLFILLSTPAIGQPAITIPLPDSSDNEVDTDKLTGLQILYGEGTSQWANKFNDPNLRLLQNQAMIHARLTGNLSREIIEVYNQNQKPIIFSQSGRLSFVTSSEGWYSVGASFLISQTIVKRLPPSWSVSYYEVLRRNQTDFMFPENSIEQLLEIYNSRNNQQLSLSTNSMLSADIWIHPPAWYIQPFLRLGFTAPVEQNVSNGIFSSSAGLKIYTNSKRSFGLIAESYADLYNVLWQDYTGQQIAAPVWDYGFRAGMMFDL
ncbi:MAG: hypothetical protein H3C43_07690 [Leptonema sp. (in: Bacteria)]|nr:hypothetical protein [Leptonema sp. (in: bacteria)]